MRDFHQSCTGAQSPTAKDFVLEMAFKVFFLLTLIGFASATLPHIRMCDAVQEQQTPTLCSNYRNIEAAYAKKEELKKMVHALEKMVDGLKEMAKDNTISLQRLEKNLTDSLAEMTNVTANQQREINHLKKEVSDLVKHKDNVRGTFNNIEQRLELTEGMLEGKTAKLRNLEHQTEAAFNDTRKLLSLYESELSKLNLTALDLEDRVEARLNTTKMDFEDELEEIQKKNAAFSTRLDKQETEFSHLKHHTNYRLDHVHQQLKTQNLTMNLLMNETADLARSLVQKEVITKVAFSATIIESSYVFTGPRIPGGRSVLIFDKIFSNVGNAYNKNTGVFTAPVKGVYQFTFMTFGYSNYKSGAMLEKNRHHQVWTWETTGTDVSDTTSNTVILELNIGDCVRIILWPGGKIHYSVFSGFLIFPMV